MFNSDGPRAVDGPIARAMNADADLWGNKTHLPDYIHRQGAYLVGKTDCYSSDYDLDNVKEKKGWVFDARVGRDAETICVIYFRIVANKFNILEVPHRGLNERNGSFVHVEARFGLM